MEIVSSISENALTFCVGVTDFVILPLRCKKPLVFREKSGFVHRKSKNVQRKRIYLPEYLVKLINVCTFALEKEIKINSIIN